MLSHVQLFGVPWTAAHQGLCPWHFPGKNPGVSCHFPLWRIFLIQGSNPCLLPLLHWQEDSLPMLHLRILHQEAESTVRCQILPPEGRNVCSQTGQQRALEDRQPCEHPGPGRFFMGKSPVHSPCVLSDENRPTLPSLTPHF